MQEKHIWQCSDEVTGDPRETSYSEGNHEGSGCCSTWETEWGAKCQEEGVAGSQEVWLGSSGIIQGGGYTQRERP